jgi:hypothetical protein
VKELPTLGDEGLTVQQMAKRQGWSRPAVYSALKRNVKRRKSELAERNVSYRDRRDRSH